MSEVPLYLAHTNATPCNSTSVNKREADGGSRLNVGFYEVPWREAGPPNHHDDKVDSDQWGFYKKFSLL